MAAAVADDCTTSREGADVNTWSQLIRRAWLDPHCKLIALLLVSYANNDGTRVHPGEARLTVNSRLNYRTVQRHLRVLRQVGLIEQASRKGVPRYWATPYRLTVPGASGEQLALDVMTPAEEEEAIEAVRKRYRGAYKPKETPDSLPKSSGGTEELHDTGDAQNENCTTDDAVLHDTGDAPPSSSTLPEDQPSRERAFGLADITPTGGSQFLIEDVYVENPASGSKNEVFLERLRRLADKHGAAS